MKRDSDAPSGAQLGTQMGAQHQPAASAPMMVGPAYQQILVPYFPSSQAVPLMLPPSPSSESHHPGWTPYEQVQVVQQIFAEIKSGELVSHASLITPECMISTPTLDSSSNIPFAGVYKGVEQIGTFTHNLHNAFESLKRFDIRDVASTGNVVYCLVDIEGTTTAASKLYRTTEVAVTHFSDRQASHIALHIAGPSANPCFQPQRRSRRSSQTGQGRERRGAPVR
eukprot:Sspe_Gene.85458::Locus_56221_Transcript_1_1_Confidence_1.000_Length_805::g.85458::m.85458